MTGNAQLLNQDELACVEQGLGRSSAQGQMNASLLKFHLFPQTSLREKGLNQGQRAEAACPIQSSVPFQDTAVPSSSSSQGWRVLGSGLTLYTISSS